MEPVPVILFCPVCCTALDTASDQEEFCCGACGQQWRMSVDTARLEQSSAL